MLDKFNLKLIELLKKDLRFVDDDNDSLIRNEIINFALKADKDLIGLLIKDDQVRNHFFDKIQEYYVFNINKFIEYVEDKNFLSNSYTKFKNQIGLNIDGKYLRERGEVSLVWPFKDCVLEGGMTKEDEKRNEIFFNEILAKDEIDRLFDTKALTNFKKFTAKGEEKVKDFNRDEKGTIKDNLIIKGNNLLALHSLKKEFAEKVKLIYIDIPFNTDNDSFKYNDSFNHSTWLTFMRNRLEIAKELLQKDGLLCIQCDDNEQAYLKVLMDEIYTRDNFINSISVQSSTPSGLKTAHRDKTIIKTKDFLLIYRKTTTSIKLTPQYTKQLNWDTHFNYYLEKENLILRKLKDVLIEKKIFDKEVNPKDYNIDDTKFKKFYMDNSKIIFQTGKSMPEDVRKESLLQKNKDKVIPYGDNQFAYNGRRLSPLFTSINKVIVNNEINLEISKLLCDIWTDIDFNNTQNEGCVSLPSGKKPEKLLHRIIDLITQKGDIVLDYHLGSGTTCAVAHKMGRQYIGIEQLDYGEDDSIVRLNNVLKGDQSGISKAVNWKGGGEFIYCELKKYNEGALDKIQDSKDTKSLLKIWAEMVEHYFLNCDVEIHKFNKNKTDFEKLSLAEQKKLLCEMLNKNQLYVNLSEIDDKQFNISKEDKELNSKFYGGN